jgi:hypothetical protein
MRPTPHPFAALAVIAAFATVSGCSSGGTTVSPEPSRPTPVPSATPTAAAPQPATLHATVTVPGKTSSSDRRAPHYISSGTLSVTFALVSVNGAAPPSATQPTLLKIGGSSCQSAPSGRVCTVDVPAFSGVDTYLVTTYATPDGTGTPLSSGPIAATVATTGGALSIDVANSQTLSPVAAAIAIVALPGAVTIGTAATLQVVVNELDASGAVIVGATFPLPIAVTAPSGFTFTPSGTSSVTLSAPTSLAVAYDGSGAPGTAAFTAATAGTGSLTATATVQLTTTATARPTSTPTATPVPTATPTPAAVTADATSLNFLAVGSTYAKTFNVAQSGYSGSFTASVSGTQGIVTVSVSGGVVTVTPAAPGQTSVVVTGGGGQNVTVSVVVTTTPGTIH